MCEQTQCQYIDAIQQVLCSSDWTAMWKIAHSDYRYNTTYRVAEHSYVLLPVIDTTEQSKSGADTSTSIQ